MVQELINKYDEAAAKAQELADQIEILKNEMSVFKQVMTEQESMIDAYLKQEGIDSMRAGDYRLYYKESKPVMYSDETLIPEEYIKKKLEIDGAKIRSILVKKGHVPGAYLGSVVTLKIEKAEG